jgi:serine/threonine protein kinase
MSSRIPKNKTIKLDSASATIRSLMAEGSNGFVYLATLNPSTGNNNLTSLLSSLDPNNEKKKRQCALKQMVCMDDEAMSSAQKEIEVMVACSPHPNIVPLLASSVVSSPSSLSSPLSPHPYVLCLCPLLDHGNLEDFINEHGTLSLPETLFLLRGIVAGVQALHDEGYRHNDIKPANILLDAGGCTLPSPPPAASDLESDLPTPALTDFGSCGPSSETVSTRKEALTLTDFHSRCTTPPYRAPELWDVYTGVALGPASDAWAVGAVVYFLLFGRHAFEFNVGKASLPHGVSYEGFSSRLCLALMLTDPKKR